MSCRLEAPHQIRRRPSKQYVQKDFREYVRQDQFPCILAKSAIKFNRVSLDVFKKMADPLATRKIYATIQKYKSGIALDSMRFKSYVAVFTQQAIGSELQFERLLWNQLKMLKAIDPKRWDKCVDSDPSSPKFSFSIAGEAFYIVGLHPESSRTARQFKYPAIVFNLHRQFEQLRRLNKYSKVKSLIRKNDLNENGSINPMLSDFGEFSEARQYSGREVDANWKCPFSGTK